MFVIKTPVKGYSGKGYGLTFVDGEAKTEDEALAKRLKILGYIVKKEKVAAKKAPEIEPPDTDSDETEPEDDSSGDAEGE